MTVAIQQTSGIGFVEIDLTGKLDADDYKHFRPKIEELIRNLRRDPEAGRRVLTVEDGEIDVKLRLKILQVVFYDRAAGVGDRVADEEDSHCSGGPHCSGGL